MKMKKRLLGILLSLALALGVSISLLSVSVFAEGEEVEETEEAVETVGDVIENETPEEVEEIVEVTGEPEEEPGMSLTAYANGTPAYSGGTGTEADPYLISTADDWKALAGAVNDGEAYTGKYFRQTADLDMSGAGNLNPVGTLEHPFAGNYEGDGFAISNAAITGMACSFQGYNMNVAGLFGALVGSGSISNLKVTNVSVTATSGSGGW
ncbi:MAG: hypothetical protein IKS32_03045, partial [Solobacterium sp.]|nr:hypothetical protein [Solobacterium sp.]